MSELRDLYQQVIIDHSRKPRNFRALEHSTQRAEGVNALCGDRFTVELDVADDTIRDIGFQGSGCAISKASASMMTADLKGKTVAEAAAVAERFHAMLTDSGRGGEAGAEALGKLAVFAGVREFPSRVKCATLAWHTLRAALGGAREPVSTE
jgi:nitrogen fixation NifU-like protein